MIIKIPSQLVQTGFYKKKYVHIFNIYSRRSLMVKFITLACTQDAADQYYLHSSM